MLRSRLSIFRTMVLVSLAVLLTMGLTIGSAKGESAVKLLDINEATTADLRVPQDYPTIQDAIDAAQSGDLILVSPGAYNQALQIAGKSITLASEFHTTGDEAFVDSTIINGGIAVDNSSAGTKIIGFTIQNGVDGIIPRSPIEVR